MDVDEKKNIFPIVHIRKLLKSEKEINISADCVEMCLTHLNDISLTLQTTILEIMTESKRKKIKIPQLKKALVKLDLNYEQTTDFPLLTKAATKRFIKNTESDFWVSDEAVFLLQNSLENYIRILGNLNEIYIIEYKKKTFNSESMKIAIESLSKAIKLNYNDFIRRIFSHEEIKKVCESNKISKSKTKEDLVDDLCKIGITIEKIVQVLSEEINFDELRHRMIRNKFPIPYTFQDVFNWVELPKITSFKQEEIELEEFLDHQSIQGDLFEESIEIIQKKKIQQKEDQDLITIIEKSINYNFYFTPNMKLKLKQIMLDFIPLSSLNNIDKNLNLEIDFEESKEITIDHLLKTGISITYYLRELFNKDIVGLLRILGLKISGNKKDLLARLLNAVEFIDYDISHDDIIFAIKGEQFIEEQRFEKEKKEYLYKKIRSYSGSLKLDLLLLMENMGFQAKESVLKQKFQELGNEPLAFFGPLGGLLRDGIFSVDPLVDDKEYFIIDSILSPLKIALVEVKSDIEKWKGAIEDLPNSSKILLNFICSYGEATETLKIREKFREIYRSNQTWRNAKEKLKERELILEELDNEKEINVMYAPKRICPILSGILVKYKDKILAVKQKEFNNQKEKLKKTIDVTLYTKGAQELLYLIVNSGGFIEKDGLRNVFTSPPGYYYSYQSFLRYLLKFKKEPIDENNFLINETIDEETRQKIVQLNYPIIDELKGMLEETLYDLNIEKEIDNLSNSTKVMIKIVLENGGTILQKELRKKFLQYYSHTTFYNVLSNLSTLLFAEAISVNGDSLLLIPDLFVSEIQTYFIKNPTEFDVKRIIKQPLEDFILNNYSKIKFQKIASLYNEKTQSEDSVTLKKLLYEQNVPIISFLCEIISKKDLSQFCIENELPHSGSKIEIVIRIVKSDLLEIESNLILQGELKNEIPKLKTDQKNVIGLEELEEENLSKNWINFIEATDIFDAISSAKSITKENLKQKAKDSDVKYSGNKFELIKEIFINSDVTYIDLFEKYLNEDVLKSLNSYYNTNEITRELLTTIMKEGIRGLPDKEKIYKLEDFLILIPKIDLQKIAFELKVSKSGNKVEIVNKIVQILNLNINENLKKIIRIIPEWIILINTKYNFNFHMKNIISRILKLIGKKEIISLIKPDKKSQNEKKTETYFKNFDGLIQLIVDSIDIDVLSESLGILNIINIKKLKQNQLIPLFEEFGRTNVKKIIKKGGIGININKNIKLICQEILELYNIPITLYDNKKPAETIKLLKLGYRKKLANGIAYFAKGDVALGVAESFHRNKKLASEFMANISANEKKDASLRGVLFEASTGHCLNELIPKGLHSKEIHGIQKVTPFADYDNYQDKKEGSDGRIEFKLINNRKPEIVHFLYDCKAYKSGYYPNQHFVEYTKYIKTAVDISARGAVGLNYKGMIIFSSKFRFQKEELRQKMVRDNFLKDFTLILFHAKALKKLYSELDREPDLMIFFPWEDIIQLNQRVIEIDDTVIIRYIKLSYKYINRTKL